VSSAHTFVIAQGFIATGVIARGVIGLAMPERTVTLARHLPDHALHRVDPGITQG
jgi:hypothetical protein